MDNANDLVISTSGLTKSYNGRPALKSLELKVPEHSIFGFLGPNGAGKTTAIKLLLGLIRPTGGTCKIFGRDVATDGLAIRHRVGYLSQDPRFYEYKTARQLLRFTARFFYDGPKDDIEARIEETLKLVDLGKKADRAIKGFSGGERQRLGIAQAWINHPELLILDEPAASLDPMGRRDVLELMGKMQKETTIFFSTHLLDDVQRICDHVAILNKGQLVAQAPIGELLSDKGSAFKLVIKGDATKVRQALAQQPWVSAVTATSSNGSTSFLVNVTDEARAQDNLLKIAMSLNVEVIDFGRRSQSIEEIFVNMVEA